MNMIEKVARAVFKVEFPNDDYIFDTTQLGKKLRLEAAKAAIQAMLEPSDEMLSFMDDNEAKDVKERYYIPMIQAALKE